MAHRPAAPRNLRNGLTWRGGRPRWEPSPASRRAGLKGMDLKTDGGSWMERGAAIDACDARALWATLVREASAPGPIGQEARTDLQAALEALETPRDAAQRHARLLVADLLAAATRLLGAPPILVAHGPGGRTVAAMVDGYFASVLAGDVDIASASEAGYATQSKKLIERMGAQRVDTVTRGQLRQWYLDLKRSHSVSTANSCIGAASAFFRWATWKDWIENSPCTQLGREAAPGRRVFYTLQEEADYVAWCDANDYADVADGLTLGLWTGARSTDMCAATLADLSQAVWRFTPHKTKRKGREAMPAILPAVKARVERRRAQTVAAIDRTFLFDHTTGRAHTPASLARRHRDARALAVYRGAAPESLIDKRIQDTRDTCVTRLYLADVALDRIPSWTGHSPDTASEILREHYLVLLEESALEDARKLEAWAAKNAVKL